MEIKPTAIYSRKDVMDLLGISTTTLSEAVNSGQLKCKELSNKWIFKGSEILAFVDSLPNAQPRTKK